MTHENYMNPSAPHPASSSQVTRREFLKRMGLLAGGIVVYVSIGDPASGTQRPTDFNAFLRIGGDGRVTCFTGKIEMGQGIITSSNT